MKRYLLISLIVTCSIGAYSQNINSYFPSRMIFQVLSPKIIIDNDITKVSITDNWFQRLSFKYELNFNKKGTIKSYNYDLTKGSSKSYSKRFRIDPIDTIFYNRTNISSIAMNNISVSIKYTQNGKISEVNFKYNTPIIGCPIRSISFNYNPDETIKDELLSTCSEIILSTYNYENDIITSVNCMDIKNDILSQYHKKDTIYRNYKVNYYPSGLLKSIESANDTSIYIRYNYTHKK